MPLAPGQACSVPVTVAAGVRSTHAAEEVYAAELCLEYVSLEAAGPLLQPDSPVSTGAAGHGTVLGRHAVLPLQVHVQPSVQVSQVQFRELYLPAAAAVGSAAAGEAADAADAQQSGGEEAAQPVGGIAAFERRCVMEVTVANRGRWPLQVWLGPTVADATHLPVVAERDLLLPPALPAAAEGLPATGLLAPGRRCTVAYILDDSALASSGAACIADPLPGALSVRPAASYEEQARTECAARLCQALSLFYRVDGEEAGISGALR